MARERILLVEDERAQRDALEVYLTRKGFEVDAYATAELAVEALSRNAYNLLLTDLRLPGADGLSLVRHASQLDEELGILMMTAYASVDSAVEALRQGAHDYLLKPLILEEVGRKVTRMAEHRELARQNVRLRRVLAGSDKEMVAESAPMKAVMQIVPRAAATTATVLITGETGTGKEVLARTIHRQSEQRDEPFLGVNLAAVPDNMVESELFGHEKGAFTGADKRREGILRAAGTGTVFIDELAEMPPSVQVKLLRVLESREARPLGSDRSVPFRARLMAATHRDLKALVEEGTFREDLYYRLNVLHIDLPPLRERAEDIPILVRDLAKSVAQKQGRKPPTITSEVLRILCQYRWRGNVRELGNVLERALVLSDGDDITIDHLPADLRPSEVGTLKLADAVERFERAHIASVLKMCEGNRDKAAAELGISPATLYRRLERLALKGYEVHRKASELAPSTAP